MRSYVDMQESVHPLLYDGVHTEFTEMIWMMSQDAFDIPREIQVVVDKNESLYISYGTPGYVEFPVEMEGGMRLPIKCWIHTHPMGKAFWSSTDLATLKAWNPLMNSAIVLGYREHQTWQKYKREMEHVRYAHTKTMINPLHPDNRHLFEEE